MAEGQFLGSKVKVVYTSDSGKTYVLNRDEDLVLAGDGLVPFDPATPGSATPPPRRFKPRGVYWESTAAPLGARKFIICGTSSASLYASDSSQTVTIDGVAGRLTGRRGETLSF